MDVYEKNNTMRSVFSPGNIFVSDGKKYEGQCDVGNDAYEIEKNYLGWDEFDGGFQLCVMIRLYIRRARLFFQKSRKLFKFNVNILFIFRNKINIKN